MPTRPLGVPLRPTPPQWTQLSITTAHVVCLGVCVSWCLPGCAWVCWAWEPVLQTCTAADVYKYPSPLHPVSRSRLVLFSDVSDAFHGANIVDRPLPDGHAASASVAVAGAVPPTVDSSGDETVFTVVQRDDATRSCGWGEGDRDSSNCRVLFHDPSNRQLLRVNADSGPALRPLCREALWREVAAIVQPSACE